MSPLNSQIAAVLNRLVYAFGAGVALGVALVIVIACEFRAANPGNPDAGQEGVLGVVVGFPLGFLVGWFVAPHPYSRLVVLASTTGMFVGGILGWYAHQPLVALFLALAGCLAGWLAVRRWTRSKRCAG